MSIMLEEMYKTQKSMILHDEYGDVLSRLIIHHPNPLGWVGYNYHGVKYVMTDVAQSSDALLAMVLPMFPNVHCVFDPWMNVKEVVCREGTIAVDYDHTYGLDAALMSAFISEWHRDI